MDLRKQNDAILQLLIPRQHQLLGTWLSCKCLQIPQCFKIYSLCLISCFPVLSTRDRTEFRGRLL